MTSTAPYALLKEVNPLPRTPGAFEVIVVRRFFRGLSSRDARALSELLGDAPTFENFDGPIPVEGREELARTLADRAADVAYELVDITATPGEASARFLLFVEGVPGSILLHAKLRFRGHRIADIVVSQPPPANCN